MNEDLSASNEMLSHRGSELYFTVKSEIASVSYMPNSEVKVRKLNSVINNNERN